MGDMRRRGVRSPDCADAFGLTFATSDREPNARWLLMIDLQNHVFCFLV